MMIDERHKSRLGHIIRTGYSAREHGRGKKKRARNYKVRARERMRERMKEREREGGEGARREKTVRRKVHFTALNRGFRLADIFQCISGFAIMELQEIVVRFCFFFLALNGI